MLPNTGPSSRDIIRLEPLGKFKQTQNGNVRSQGGSLYSFIDVVLAICSNTHLRSIFNSTYTACFINMSALFNFKKKRSK